MENILFYAASLTILSLPGTRRLSSSSSHSSQKNGRWQMKVTFSGAWICESQGTCNGVCLRLINQDQYVQEILQRFSMEVCNPWQLPMAERPILSTVPRPENFKITSKAGVDQNFCPFPYASALGCIFIFCTILQTMTLHYITMIIPQHYTTTIN